MDADNTTVHKWRCKQPKRLTNDKRTQSIQASTGDPTDRDGQTIQETTVPTHLQAGITTADITNRKRKKTERQTSERSWPEKDNTPVATGGMKNDLQTHRRTCKGTGLDRRTYHGQHKVKRSPHGRSCSPHSNGPLPGPVQPTHLFSHLILKTIPWVIIVLVFLLLSYVCTL